VSEQTPEEIPTEARTPEDTVEVAAPAASTGPVASDVAEGSRARRKVRVGVVVSDKMDKTVLVRIDRRVRHPLYKKTVARSNKLAAHDESNDAHVGDTVKVVETRPLSKSKRWRVVEIVERAK
jgi:small subunit ribosomal protein S17